MQHMIMDGVNYKKAVAQHKDGVVDAVIRQRFEEYTKRGIFFIRDGGDACGVSKRAAQLACEYGITYRTPVFALHKRGHYGGIVGLPFSDFSEYRDRIAQVRTQGGHFIKLMFSGILDFSRGGAMTEAPLQRDEIRELIHIAHEEGFSVMAHVNGAAPCAGSGGGWCGFSRARKFSRRRGAAGTVREPYRLGTDLRDDHKPDRERTF